METNQAHFQTLLNLSRISHGGKCLVRSSDKCKRAFDQMGLTPAEFLRPFGRMTQKIEFNSINNKKRLIQNFQINFIDDKEYRIPSKQQIEVLLQRVLERNLPNLDLINIQYKTKEEVETHLENQRTYWFEKCSEVILDPLYLINFISADDQDPLRALQQMEQETSMQLKEIFKNNPQEIQNNNIPRANFIVYDSSNQRQVEIANNLQRDLRQKYDQYLTRVIPINSPQAIFDLQPWEPFLDARYFSQVNTPFDKRKRILSQEDFVKIQMMFNEFILSFLVPNIEQKIKAYHANYLSQKKTSISSTFRKLFNREETKPESGGAYQMAPFEILVRYIGDLLFLMHDYEQAQEFYKQCQDAFKSKSYRHYASATEMMAYSQVMCHHELKLPHSKNEVQQIINSLTESISYYSYQLNHIHFTIRGIIFKIFVQFLYDKFDQIVNQQVYDIGYLIKDRPDTPKINQYPIIHCLLQEQFAIMHLKQKPLRSRKYCQNLLYAGYQYGKSKFKVHSLRCFLVIEKEYEFSKWTQLQDFIYKQLAKYFIEISDFKNSYKYVKLLLKNVEKRDSQEKHAQTILDTETFLSAFEKSSNFPFADDDEQIYIPLPEVSQKSLDILTSDEMMFDGQNQKFPTLQSMYVHGVLNNVLQAERDKSVLHWDEMGVKLLNCSKEKETMSRLEIERENCILKSFSALCTEDKQSSFDLRGDSSSQFRIGYVDEMITIKFELSNPLKKSFKIEEFGLFYEFQADGESETTTASQYIQEQKKSFEIGELKKFQVSFKIIPTRQGMLVIKGLQWKVFRIPVTFTFDVKGKLQKDGITKFNNFSNRIKVFPSTGKLIIRSVNFENKLYFGEIKPMTLEFKNEGATVISDVKIIFSEPYIYGRSSLELKNITIQPGQTHLEKIYIRSSSSKECLVKFLIVYKSETNPFFRYARFLQNIPVSPSFILVHSPLYVCDQNSIHLLVDDQFHQNFIKAKPEEPKMQQQISSGPNILLQSTHSTNLLDLDFTGDAGGSTLDQSNSNRAVDENYSLRIHQLILIDNNWRFATLPYQVTSAEKSYYYNIILRRLSLSKRKTSHYHSQDNDDLLDLLGEEEEINNQKNMDLLDFGEEEPVPSIAAAAGTIKKIHEKNQIQSQQSLLSDVDESDMHFLNLDNNQLMTSFKEINNFCCDFSTIKNYINYDRQLLYDKYWDKDIDFDHPDLVSITVAWTYKTPERIYSGLHGLPKVRMNPTVIHNKKSRQSPFDLFPLKINIDYPQQVKHNFSLDPVCSVNVQVKIKNLYCQDPISFSFLCVNGDESLTTQNDEQYPFFIWEGETERTISNLDYQGEETISLTACFTCEGLYSINRFKYFFFRNKETRQLVEPLTQSELAQNKKIDYKSFMPLDKEQYFLNIINQS